MVTLSRIYTRTGDAGETRLSDMSLVHKTDSRVEAYGHVDEANSVIGLALATGQLPPPIKAALHDIQNELFDVGADLSNPLSQEAEFEPLRILQSSVDRLERWCDEFGDPLPDLTSFILPGGTQAASLLHVARTVVRRAERAAWRIVDQYGTEAATLERPGGANLVAIRYLNRLSDLLFIMTRVVNGGQETLWVPGKDRAASGPKAKKRRDRIERQQAATDSESQSADPRP